MKNNTKDSKQMLFEMMQKVNPDFKIIKEYFNPMDRSDTGISGIENTHKHMYLISFQSEAIPPQFETKRIKIGANDEIEALRKALLNLEKKNFINWNDKQMDGDAEIEDEFYDESLHSYKDFIIDYGDTLEKIIRTVSQSYDIELNINKIR